MHARYRGRGGEDTTVGNEREVLESAGHEVRLFEAQNSPTATGAALQLTRSVWNRAAAAQMARELAEFEPDVVHVHNTWFALSHSVIATANRLGYPTVFTVQNYRLVCVSANLFRDGQLCEDCVGRGPWPGIKHRCYRDSALASSALAFNITTHRVLRTWERYPDVVVAVSNYGVDRHVAGGVPRERIVVKDNLTPDPGPRSREPSASREVLFVGRSDPEKGLDLLLEAWRTAAPDNLTLNVLGASRPVSPASGNVRFLGSRPTAEVRKQLLAARALLVPSQWPEGQPLVILEALAAGLPVVGSAVGGIDEVLAEHPSAERVPLGDPGGWARALDLLGDDTTIDAQGRQSRELYERRFDPATGLENLLATYRRAIDRRRGAETAGTGPRG